MVLTGRRSHGFKGWALLVVTTRRPWFEMFCI